MFDASYEWSAEQSDDVVLITDQDGIGELALTTLVRASGAGEEITHGYRQGEIAGNLESGMRRNMAVLPG